MTLPSIHLNKFSNNANLKFATFLFIFVVYGLNELLVKFEWIFLWERIHVDCSFEKLLMLSQLLLSYDFCLIISNLVFSSCFFNTLFRCFPTCFPRRHTREIDILSRHTRKTRGADVENLQYYFRKTFCISRTYWENHFNVYSSKAILNWS